MSIIGDVTWIAVATLIYGLPVYIIARKCEHPYAWLAFVPFGFLWLEWDLSGTDTIWLVLSFLPFVCLISMIVIWMGIAETTNKESALGILMVIPGVNILVAYYMAIYEPRERG